MDPLSVAASLSGLVLAITQLTSAIYSYCKEVKGAKAEISQLCSDLFALKGALEHMRLNLETSIDIDDDEKQTTAPSTSLVRTEEFNDMLSTTDTFVKSLSKGFNKSSGRRQALKTSLAWPLKKNEIQNELQRLERIKSYFVLANTTDNLELTKQVYIEVHSIASAVDGQQKQQKRKAEEKFRQSVIEWLAPYNPTALYRAALSSKQPGTGKWFIDGPLRNWLSDHSSEQVLLLRGKSGTGKTTLISASYDETNTLDSDSDHRATAYFFCSFTDLSSQEPVNLFGSLLVQLCSFEPNLWAAVDHHFPGKQRQSSSTPIQLNLVEIQALFEQTCKALPNVLIFIDAVNESKQPALILSTLWKLIQSLPHLRVVLSSTEELFASPLDSPMPSHRTIRMTPNMVDEDIRDYVESWLAHHDRLRSLPPRLKHDIRSKLVSESNGVFRWVKCQLKELVLKKTPAAMKTALDTVPATLEQTYCNILLRIPNDDREIAKKSFMWLVFSIRMMTFSELCEAVVIDERRAGVDENARLLQPEDLLQICSSLIEYDSKKQTIALAHSSVPQYLISTHLRESHASEFWIDPNTADAILTCKCISYLRSRDLASGYCDTMTEFTRRWDDLPFLDYAVHGWQTHAKYLNEGDIDNLTKNIFLGFFETAKRPRGGNFGAWIQLFLPFAEMNIENSTPLYYAARFGLTSILKMILAVQGKKDLETLGGRRDSTPLHVASAFGRVQVVKTLLEAGANAREINGKGESGLRWACLYGSSAIVRMLLKAGADPSCRDRRGCTPLYYAIVNQEYRCAAELLDAGADSENIDGNRTSVAALGDKSFLEWNKVRNGRTRLQSTTDLDTV